MGKSHGYNGFIQSHHRTSTVTSVIRNILSIKIWSLHWMLHFTHYVLKMDKNHSILTCMHWYIEYSVSYMYKNIYMFDVYVKLLVRTNFVLLSKIVAKHMLFSTKIWMCFYHLVKYIKLTNRQRFWNLVIESKSQVRGDPLSQRPFPPGQPRSPGPQPGPPSDRDVSPLPFQGSARPFIQPRKGFAPNLRPQWRPQTV